MYKEPDCFQIKTRHLIFNILAKCNGKIKRDELYERIYKAGHVLAKKGYNLPIALMGSKDGGYWNDDIDSELWHWIKFGIIKNTMLKSEDEDLEFIRLYPEKHQLYTFIPKDQTPFDSLDTIIKWLDRGLDREPRNALEEALKIAFDRNYKKEV